MLFRFLFIVLIFGGGFAYFHYMADDSTKEQFQEIITDTKTQSEETKETLIAKKNELESKLKSLQEQITDKVKQGQDKVEEVHANIVATKEAIEEVENSIKTLNESLGLGKENYLTRICEDKICEIGTPCGYINSKGDVIIPIGQFYSCYSDTITDFGIVLDKNSVYKAIDNTGQYLYDVKQYDNGPDAISEGLFRIIINGKTGYANEQGEVIIEPKYACTTPFENGQAKVSNKCDFVDDGEYKIMKSENWFYINKKGEKIDTVF